MSKQPTMPSEVGADVGFFDRFAGAVSRHVSRAWFFACCVALIVLWVPSYPLWGNGDTYQLIVNTGTTIVTFLLVALLQNTQQRADQATQHKLNALASGVAVLLDHAALRASEDRDESQALRLLTARGELCQAVGLEERESTS